MSYYVYITQTPQYFVAEVPALPGCRTIGRSEMEVIENIRDVVRGYYQSMRKRNRAVPKVKVVKVSSHSPEASSHQGSGVMPKRLPSRPQPMEGQSSDPLFAPDSELEVARLGSASV
ncbi:MAG: type II toxin-antitoxin system HicB family antitoxin [Nitrospiria bacterium]